MSTRERLEADVARVLAYLGTGYEPFDRIVKLARDYVDLVADIEATEPPVKYSGTKFEVGDVVRLTGEDWTWSMRKSGALSGRVVTVTSLGVYGDPEFVAPDGVTEAIFSEPGFDFSATLVRKADQ